MTLFNKVKLANHLFNVLSINFVNMLRTSHTSVVTTVNLSKNVRSVCSSSFDFAAFFNFKTLNCAFYTFHFWHMLSLDRIFHTTVSNTKWDGIIPKYPEVFIKLPSSPLRKVLSCYVHIPYTAYMPFIHFIIDILITPFKVHHPRELFTRLMCI